MAVNGHKNLIPLTTTCFFYTTELSQSIYTSYWMVFEDSSLTTLSIVQKWLRYSTLYSQCCQTFKISLSHSIPPPPPHFTTGNNIKIDRRLEKVALSLESKIFFDDVVSTTRVVGNANLANFNSHVKYH